MAKYRLPDGSIVNAINNGEDGLVLDDGSNSALPAGAQYVTDEEAQAATNPASRTVQSGYGNYDVDTGSIGDLADKYGFDYQPYVQDRGGRGMRADGTFQGQNGIEQAVMTEGGYRVPLGFAQQNGLKILGNAQADPDYGPHGLDKLFTNYGPAIIAAMATAGATGGFDSLGSLFGSGQTAGAGSLFDAAVDGGAVVNGTGYGAGAATAGGAGAALGSGEDAMLQAARAAQLNTLAGNGMTGMYSGIAPGLAGTAMSAIDKLGIGGSAGMTALNAGANFLGSAAGSSGNGGYQIPWDKIIGGGMEYLGQQQYGSDIADAMKYAVDKADPFSSQRPFYQGQLQQMFTDPNYFNNNALLKGANDNAVNDTSRAMAARGYNMSGNEMQEIGQRLQNNNMSFAQDLMSKTGGYAGAGFGPGQAGTIAGNLGSNVAASNQASNGALGTIFNGLYNGQQPSSAQQSQGTQPNQNLYSYLFS